MLNCFSRILFLWSSTATWDYTIFGGTYKIYLEDFEAIFKKIAQEHIADIHC